MLQWDLSSLNLTWNRSSSDLSSDLVLIPINIFFVDQDWKNIFTWGRPPNCCFTSHWVRRPKLSHAKPATNTCEQTLSVSAHKHVQAVAKSFVSPKIFFGRSALWTPVMFNVYVSYHESHSNAGKAPETKVVGFLCFALMRLKKVCVFSHQHDLGC